MFGDSDGSKDASAAAPGSNPMEPPIPNRELTLSSYLCGKAPPNPEGAAPTDDAKLCVERDFLHLSAPKRRDESGDDASVVGAGGKNPRLDSLSLSLSNDASAPPPSSSLPPSQFASLLPVDGDLRGGSAGAAAASVPAAAPPPRRTYSANAGRTRSSFDGSRGGMHSSRPERILRDIVSDPVPAMAQVLQDFPSETLEVLRETVRTMIDAPDKKRDELLILQRKLERRSDLTAEVLGRANETQLEILVAIKNGMATFVTGKGRVSSSELVEMFLLARCRNMKCKSVVPVDNCECRICSTNKGFCSACSCLVCQQFDDAANTCSWVGCDVCCHWCHAACALEKDLIRPGPSLKGPMGTTEMQFQCLGCNHASEMFGFVKEVFDCCAANWSPETQMKELDFVRKIFAASEDFKGKGLHAKTEEVLVNATKTMLQFLKCEISQTRFLGLPSSPVSPEVLPLELLRKITDDFSEKHRLGSGTFGRVYKGILDGKKVAVKLLHSMSQRLDYEEEFMKEFENLRRLNHPNIVQLLGYCYEIKRVCVEYEGKYVLADKIYRALCFDYMHNGSLKRHLDDKANRLDWPTCYKIIKGTCEGLKYLHEGSETPMYHLDLKPGNILLDKKMVPKIADFGLSKLVYDNETRATSSFLGTKRYCPPEYIEQGYVSNKFDIFSLGVVMIEIIAGPEGYCKAAEMPCQEFIDHVQGNWRERLEATPGGTSLIHECRQVQRCIEIALECVSADRKQRPNIGDITSWLSDIENNTEKLATTFTSEDVQPPVP